MKNKLLVLLFVTVLCIGGSANAQLYPLDTLGIVDTLDLSITVDTVGGSVVAELYVFSDYTLIGATVGFTWQESSALLTLDSAKETSIIETAFDLGRFFYFDNDINKTNDSMEFIFGGSNMFSSGLAGETARRLWATYYFTMNWTGGNSVVFDTLTFSSPGSKYVFSIKDPIVSLSPYWTGRYVFKAASDVTEIPGDLPETYSLSQNYPNPFNPNTVINFDVPVKSHVSLKVYNILGQLVETLVDKEMSPGPYEATFDGTGIASGIYFYKLETDKFTETKKMVLVK